MIAGRGPVTFSVTVAMCVLATVFVAARFFTRIYIVRSVKKDDWWILAAWLCALAFSIAICIGVSDGLGVHWDDIQSGTRDDFRRAQYAYSILYNPCLMLTKTSIIVFYLSVMSKDADPIFKWCDWITLAVVNIAGLALTCLNIFQCRPIPAGYLYPTPEDASCTDIVTLYLSSAPVNIITDLALLLLPMPILTGLRLPRKQKIILICTFSAGIFVVVVDIVRIAYLQNASLDRFTTIDTGGGTQRIVETSDFSWDASLSFMWSAIEVNIGIICACVPSLKALFLKFAPSFIKDNDSGIDSGGSMDGFDKQEPLSTMNTNANVLTHPAAFRTPTIAEYAGDDDGDFMGFLNMLADEPERRERPRKSSITSRALTRTTSAVSATSDFGFVKMDKNRNMLKLTNRQSLWAVFVVTAIFFLWGFAYGLLDVLNSQFQSVANLSQGQAHGLHGAYYAGYFVGPLTLGRFFLHRYGFKSTMILGLCLYGCGTLVFWPSAVLLSYPAFIVSNFIVGCGLSCLEVASNPYIALCGPLEYAEVRLNFSQAFQAVGSVCSPLLAQKVLFKSVANSTSSLVSVQWAYLGISLFDFLLALIFYYIPLPEATEEQLEEQAERRSAVYRTRVKPFNIRVVWVTLGLGCFAQWCYVGAQEGNGFSASSLIAQLGGDRLRTGQLDALDFETLNRTSFALGRFLGSFLNYVIKPRWLLMSCFTGSIILVALQMNADGATGIIINNLINFFQGSIFPIVYAISMRGMGDQTFNAAALMTATISSGAVVPPIVWAVRNARGLKYSYSVILAIYCFGSIFALYLNLVPAAIRQVDPVHENRSRRRRTFRRATTARTNSQFSETGVSEITEEKQFGIQGIIARRRKNHKKHMSGVSFLPSSQHIEESDPNMSPLSPKQSRQDDDSLTSTSITTPAPAKVHNRQRRVSLQPDVHYIEPDARHEEVPTIEESDAPDLTMSGGSGEDLGVPPPQPPRREWTEEDDVRDDYHKILMAVR
ncbi:hypothetical protein LTS08_008063 [Lithohypha guttulata]|nr:hypothetical protein LTS08_008063 [Lithohypha guttulata]